MNPWPLVIYHGNCADGFGAAWALWKKMPECDFVPGVYQQSPPDCTGRNVIFLDFAYKLPTMLEIAQAAKSITVLDHHKSALLDLAPLQDQAACPVNMHFDMSRSGAVMAWDHVFPDKTAPALLQVIQDRDLWKFEKPGTREIQSAVFSYPYDFQLWDHLISEYEADLYACKGDPLETQLYHEGLAIERKHSKDIDELLAVCMRTMDLDGHLIPVASLPYTMTSEACHRMHQRTGAPFAACYWDTGAGRVFSLRSPEGGLDVSVLAEQYGGGGHKHAAGFSVPRDHELAGA